MSNNRNNNNRSSGKPVTATAALLDVYNSLKTSSTPAPKSPILKNKSILPVVIGDNLNSLDHIDNNNNNTNNKINNTKVTTTTKATNDNENNKESSNNTSLTAATNTINTNKTSTTGIAAGSKKNEKVLSSDDNNNLSNNFNLDFPLTNAIHVRILFAVFDYAIRKASPKKLMKLMEYLPESLTSEHVKSHLQKFRMHYAKTRDVEIKHVTEALKAEQERRKLANNSNNDNLSGDKLKKLLSIYPIHNKGMNYYRTYISESKIRGASSKRKRRRNNNVASSPKSTSGNNNNNNNNNNTVDKNSNINNNNNIKKQKVAQNNNKKQMPLIENAGTTTTTTTTTISTSSSSPPRSATMVGNSSNNIATINPKISKLRNEMDILMKRHQQNLKTQNQQVLRYSYMSNVKNAIPDQAVVGNISSKDSSPRHDKDGFSRLQDALAGLHELVSDGANVANDIDDTIMIDQNIGEIITNSLQNSPIKRIDGDK